MRIEDLFIHIFALGKLIFSAGIRKNYINILVAKTEICKRFCGT